MEQGHRIGEEAVPFARDFSDTSVEIESGNSSMVCDTDILHTPYSILHTCCSCDRCNVFFRVDMRLNRSCYQTRMNPRVHLDINGAEKPLLASMLPSGNKPDKLPIIITLTTTYHQPKSPCLMPTPLQDHLHLPNYHQHGRQSNQAFMIGN